MQCCSAPSCHQDASGLRSDGLCFAHGKEADGLFKLREPRERMPTAWTGRSPRAEPRFHVPDDWVARRIARMRAKDPT